MLKTVAVKTASEPRVMTREGSLTSRAALPWSPEMSVCGTDLTVGSLVKPRGNLMPVLTPQPERLRSLGAGQLQEVR